MLFSGMQYTFFNLKRKFININIQGEFLSRNIIKEMIKKGKEKIAKITRY